VKWYVWKLKDVTVKLTPDWLKKADRGEQIHVELTVWAYIKEWFIHESVSVLSDKLSLGGIFCDVAISFDCVNYILLSKLNFSGIIGKDYEWIKLYPKIVIS
jgi:hypothetical protein